MFNTILLKLKLKLKYFDLLRINVVKDTTGTEGRCSFRAVAVFMVLFPKTRTVTHEATRSHPARF
jgi:hypothetical protein